MSYCVYVHTFPNGKRYVGITSQEPCKRWANGNGYAHNKHMTRAVKKYGWNNIKHEIVLCGLSKAEAERKEVELISLYESNSTEHGYNITCGGESIGKHSEASKKKMSEALKGRPSQFKGKTHTAESKQHMRDAIAGKAVLKISLDGTIICEYPKMVLAAEDIGAPKSTLAKCCNGINLTSNGFIWMYKEDYAKGIEERLNKIQNRQNQKTQFTKNHIPHNASGKILCIETGEIFGGTRQAALAKGVCETGISAVIHGRMKTCGGYHFKIVV